MSEQDNSGAAYPCVTEDYLQDGLTKREAFAMAAMQGIAGNPSTPIATTADKVAKMAANVADALLAELAKGGAA